MTIRLALVVALVVGGLALFARSSASAQGCEVPPAAYDQLSAKEAGIALLMEGLTRQYEGPERDTPEYQQALLDAVTRAGFTYVCDESQFRSTAEVEAERAATGDRGGGSGGAAGGSPSTTVPGLVVTDLAALRVDDDEDHLGVWVLTGILITVAVVSAVNVARRQ